MQRSKINMKKVVYYARVSTQEDEQLNALQDQILELESFINEQEDWKLVDKYIDEGKSGTTTKNRIAYNKLFEELSGDKFDVIVIKDETRLNRNPLEWYKFIDKLLKNEKELYFYMDRKFYSPDDSFLVGIKALMANEYSRDLSKKLNNAHKQRQKKGKPLINNRIWGYNLTDTGEIVINEEEAKVIRFIFDEYVSGKGVRLIQQELIEKGISNRNGEKFSLTTLKRIIRNEKYKGDLVSNKTHKNFDTKKVERLPKEQWIVHKNAFPKIIDEETWNEASKLLESKKALFSNKDKEKETLAGYFKGNHIYSTKIICGECGRSYYHNQRPNCKEDVWQCGTYTLYGTKTKNGCVNYKFPTKVIDQIVKKVIFDYWNNKEKNIETTIETLNQVLNENSYKDKLEKLTNDKIKLLNKKDKLLDFLYDEIINKEEFISQKQKLDDKINIISKEIDELNSENMAILNKKERLGKIEKSLYTKISNENEITEELIKCFLDKIIVKSKYELEVYIYGDESNFKVKVEKNKDGYHNVVIHRQNRFIYFREFIIL